jgi:hypothetical protein
VTHLSLSLSIDSDGLQVVGRWDGLVLARGEVLGEIRMFIAGAPCVALEADEFAARDERGPLPLREATTEGEGEPVRRWTVERATKGRIVVSYLATAVTEWLPSPHPPLELRREADGFSGAFKCFLVLPPGVEEASFELTWESASDAADTAGPVAVCSLGQAGGSQSAVSGVGLDVLTHTYVMCSTDPVAHHAVGDISTWWLTAPPFDVKPFTQQLSDTYREMAATFDAAPHPFRVFLRASPHRGMSASAHPASFVVAMDPTTPADERVLQRTVAHELVHEWLHLDGPTDSVTWFNEGAADYYALVVSLRRGVIDDQTFLSEVNTAARLGYASPFHGLTLVEAERLYWSDFRAHRLPYVRGMFYLADLDARLRQHKEQHTLDQGVRQVLSKQRAGMHVGLAEWCAIIDDLLGEDERAKIGRFVFNPGGRPRQGTFGSRFIIHDTEVPIVDPGFAADTFPARQVHGLVPGGPADRAGLTQGETVQLPTYEEAANLNVGDELIAEVWRDGRLVPLAIPLGGRSIVVPQWRLSGD